MDFRRQLVYMMLEKKEELHQLPNFNIYEDADITFKSFLSGIYTGALEGERPILMTLAYCWNVAISIIYATGTVEKVGHSESLRDSDIILIYNDQDHYTGAGMYF